LLGLNSIDDIKHESEYANTSFRLRHLNSGQHMTLKPSKNKEKYVICLAGNQDTNNQYYSQEYLQDTLFTVESQSVDPDERLKSSIVVKIKHIMTNTYVSTSSSIERPRTEVNHAKNLEEQDYEIAEANGKSKGSFKLNTSSQIDTDIAKHFLE